MDRVWTIFVDLLRNDGEATLYGLAAIAALTLAEQVWPAEPGQSTRGRLRNLVFLAQFKVLGLAALSLWYAFGPKISAQPTVLDPELKVVVVVLNLLAIDLFYYAYHRAQHRFLPLWAIHELHHADAELNATSSYRTYWLEAPVQAMLVVTPTAVLFGHFGPEHGRIVLACSVFFLILSHANLRLDFGPLTDWIIGPQVHRIHHSRLDVHRDRNFAQVFPFLDGLFGTYHRPSPQEFPPTGTEHLASDAPFRTVMARPFRIWSGREPVAAATARELAGEASGAVGNVDEGEAT